MKKIECVLVLFVSLCVSPRLYGQAIGSFSGTVVDKSGSVISGAEVTVISQGTGLSRTTKTDSTGHYLIPLLPVSVYTLRVEFQGFQSAESKDLRLQVDEARELDFTDTRNHAGNKPQQLFHEFGHQRGGRARVVFSVRRRLPS